MNANKDRIRSQESRLARQTSPYEEAKLRLAGRRSFVQDIPAEKLRRVIARTEEELVGHWPQETH